MQSCIVQHTVVNFGSSAHVSHQNACRAWITKRADGACRPQKVGDPASPCCLTSISFLCLRTTPQGSKKMGSPSASHNPAPGPRKSRHSSGTKGPSSVPGSAPCAPRGAARPRSHRKGKQSESERAGSPIHQPGVYESWVGNMRSMVGNTLKPGGRDRHANDVHNTPQFRFLLADKASRTS